MKLVNINCKICKGSGKIYGHGAYGESESYSCDCGISANTVDEAKKLRDRLKSFRKQLKQYIKEEEDV